MVGEETVHGLDADVADSRRGEHFRRRLRAGHSGLRLDMGVFFKG